MTRAIILAAGFGTRLGTLSDELPKPLLPVADIPLIRYAVALLTAHGIQDIVVNLHHRGELISAELGDGSSMGARIAYSHEERILGTAGGIRRALPLLGDGPLVIVNGKILIDLDLGEVLARHRASGAMATLVVRPDAEARRWGAIDAPSEGGPIRGILGEGAYMFTGVHVVESSLIARLPDDGSQRCMVKQGYIPWLAEGVPLHAYVAGGYFMEHSTPARYLEGNFNVLRGIARGRFPGVVTGIDPRARVAPSAAIALPVRIGPGATIGEGCTIGPDVVVGAGATVASGLRIERTVVWPGAFVEDHTHDCIVTARQRVSV